MTTKLKGYGRSTHNLSRSFKTTMAPGTLVPAYVNLVHRGDSWDIDVHSIVRTHPTLGPLFDSFKMQVDFFYAPLRLYVSALHNNRTGVGLKMDQVKLPMMRLRGPNLTEDMRRRLEAPNLAQVSSSSLVSYLGVSGLGGTGDDTIETVQTEKTAIPLLMYNEVYKNYYAPLNEKKGRVLAPSIEETAPNITDAEVRKPDGSYRKQIYDSASGVSEQSGIFEGDSLVVNGTGMALSLNVYTLMSNATGSAMAITTFQEMVDSGRFLCTQTETQIILTRTGSGSMTTVGGPIAASSSEVLVRYGKMDLVEFPLENIDLMRDAILEMPAFSQLILNKPGTPGTIAENSPYNEQIGSAYDDGTGLTPVHGQFEFGQAGLLVKSHLSDKFNNWLSSDWVEGAGSVASISAIDVSGGVLQMDALNLMQKVYNVLNRVIVSGNSYKDWVLAVYDERLDMGCESPVYLGGYSAEIVFNEIVSVAESTSGSGEPLPLGSLGGRGTAAHAKGGRVTFKPEEDGFVMAIVSLTPRVSYCQGNEWWTSLDNMNELHKPELDAIGFQDLMLEEMSAAGSLTDTTFRSSSPAIGKQPSWIDYMTNFDRVYGAFSRPNELMYMNLIKRYDHMATDGSIMPDVSAMIDPAMYNYIFAQQGRDAENFWVMLGFDAKVRRKMSAKLIPNL